MFPSQARGQVLGEDGVRVHSMVLPGLPSSTTVYFSRPGEVVSSFSFFFPFKKKKKLFRSRRNLDLNILPLSDPLVMLATGILHQT